MTKVMSFSVMASTKATSDFDKIIRTKQKAAEEKILSNANLNIKHSYLNKKVK